MAKNYKVNAYINNNVNHQKQLLLNELGISRIYQNEDTEDNQTYPYFDVERTQYYRCENIDISDEEYNTLLSIQKNNKVLNNQNKKYSYYKWAIAFIILTIVAVFFLCINNKSNMWLWIGIGINDIFLVGLPLLILSKIEENTRL